MVAIAYEIPENLLPIMKYGGVVISDYPTLDIVRAYKSNRIKPGFMDRRLKRKNATLPITFMVNSSGIIVRKFTGHLFSRAKSEELLYAIAKYL